MLLAEGAVYPVPGPAVNSEITVSRGAAWATGDRSPACHWGHAMERVH
jgi:hypothetical protein